MQFNPKDLLSPDVLLFDILEEASDKDFREMTRGWYVGKIQEALNEVEFDVKFNIYHHDQQVPEDLRMEVPVGCYSVEDIFLYNGELNKPSAKPIPINWKRNMLRSPGAEYSANVRGGSNSLLDAYMQNSNESQLFFNITNRIIDLSSGCSSYEYIRIVFAGTSIPLGNVPFVPPFLKSYVHTWVVENYWRVLKGRYPAEPRYRTNWMDMRGILESTETGSINHARLRLKRLDGKFKKDLNNYISRMNY